MNERFIVAEITRNWPGSETPLISEQFQAVINLNYDRGYSLQSWKFNVHDTDDGFVETIIAVFYRH